MTISYERGAALLETLNQGAVERLRDALEPLAPGFAEIAIGHAFGDVYTRPGLDMKTRQLASIVCLCTLGNARPQLMNHIKVGLNMGWTIEEIVEAMIQAAVYAGMPVALNGIAAADEVYRALQDGKAATE